MTPEEFKQLLRDKNPADIVDQHIISDDTGPYVSRSDLETLEQKVRTKFRIRDELQVSAIVVGSAKLGFAFLEKRSTTDQPGKPAYRQYTPGESDIDVAVVSPAIYTTIWQDLARHGAEQVFFPWQTGHLADYMLHGWIRLDKFPYGYPTKCRDWKDVIFEINRMPSFRYKRLRCALYHNKQFLKLYQQRGLSDARKVEMAT